MEKQLICSICGKPIKGYGHNSVPVKEGRCCDECNVKVVIPTRTHFFETLNKGSI